MTKGQQQYLAQFHSKTASHTRHAQTLSISRQPTTSRSTNTHLSHYTYVRKLRTFVPANVMRASVQTCVRACVLTSKGFESSIRSCILPYVRTYPNNTHETTVYTYVHTCAQTRHFASGCSRTGFVSIHTNKINHHLSLLVFFSSYFHNFQNIQ